MFDVQATIRWVQGIISDPNATAVAYREPLAGWQSSLMVITIPVYVVSFLVAALIALITGGNFVGGSVVFFLVSLVWAVAWTFVIAFIFDWLAGTFGGNRDYNAAYGLVALAIIPAALGTALSPVPWLGWLISLAAGIYSLLLAYRFIPGFLAVPEDARVKHFILTIICAFVVNLVVSILLSGLFAPAMNFDDFGSQFPDEVETSSDAGGATAGGLFGGVNRQAEIAESAANDRYDPPADGRLTEQQVERYVYVLEKTQTLRSRLTERLEAKTDQEEPSISDVFGGISDAMRAGTAEMEVVKTAGGNWAEHQWVREQIETARIHQDLNANTKHNYGLFQRYEEKLSELGY